MRRQDTALWVTQAMVGLVLAAAGARAQVDRPLRQVLFDFEEGVSAWTGNPWGGGTCGPEASADAAQGDGALVCRYADVDRGDANVIGPYFAPDAAWRAFSWGTLTFWLKGDGSNGPARVILECDEAEHPTYSRHISLQPREWHRISMPLGTLWNRGGKTIDVSRLRRIYFGSRGTRTFCVDRIALEAPHRVMPVESLPVAGIPRVNLLCELDGIPKEPCWKRAATLPDLHLIDGRAAAVEQTECRVFHDGERLYVAAILRTARPQDLKATFTRHDAPIYQDDSFEVFLGTAQPGNRYVQFVVNPLGTTADLSDAEHGRFEHDWRAAAARREDGWSVELSIALEPLVDTPVAGRTMSFNVARENRVNGELSQWAPTGRSFLVPERFGQVLFLPSEEVAGLRSPQWLDFGNGLYAVRFGDAADPGLETGVHAELRFGREAFEAEGHVGTDLSSWSEFLLPVETTIAEEGWARVVTTAGPVRGTTNRLHAGRFRIFQPAPEDAPSVVPIVPSPKDIELTQSDMLLDGGVAIRFPGGPVDARNREWLKNELAKWYGVRCSEDGRGDVEVVLWQGTDENGSVPLDPELRGRIPSLPEEGYILEVDAERALLFSRTDRGMHHGILTLLQLVEAASAGREGTRLPGCRIVDWPDLRWRAVRLGVPTNRWGHPNNAPVDIDFFCRFVERSIVRRKLNMLVIEVNSGLQYASRPGLAGSAAWTRAEFAKLVALCRSHFVELVPLVNSYGHAGYLTLRHSDLREDGRLNTICTRHPESWALLTDLYAELLELCKPVRYFHVGLDEIRWQTLDVPEDKRCPRCAGTPKGDLLAEHVTRLRDWFADRGVRPVIWGDQLLADHNGGAPYHSATALEKLPRDVIIANWSTSLAPTSNCMFSRAGFTVWQSNSRGVNREQAAFCEGNMFGAWDKRPWLADCPWRSGQSYNFLSFLMASEYSWNLWPDLQSTKPGLSRPWFRRRERTLALDALQPEPHAAGEFVPVDIQPNASSTAAPENQADGPGWFGNDPERDLRHLPRGMQTVEGVPFRLLKPGLDCVRPTPDHESVVLAKVGRPVSSLRFLHALHIAAEEHEAMVEAFKDAAFWAGIPCGTYSILYADGTRATCPLLYPYNVRPWQVGDRIPYLFRSTGVLFGATAAMKKQSPDGRDVCLHVAQWVNPRPELPVESVTLDRGSLGTPAVFAVTAGSVGRPRSRTR